MYPILCIDALNVKVRGGCMVTSKAAPPGHRCGRRRHRERAGGIWLRDSKGVKFWLNILAQLKNRGHSTSVDAAVKLHSLGIRRIEGRHIDGGGPIPPGRVRGTLGWNRAMNHFMLASPDRLPR